MKKRNILFALAISLLLIGGLWMINSNMNNEQASASIDGRTWNLMPSATVETAYKMEVPTHGFNATMASLDYGNFDEAIFAADTRVFYYKKFAVSYGQTISFVGTTKDKGSYFGGQYISDNKEICFAIDEYDADGNILFTTNWMKSSEVYQVGITENGFEITPNGSNFTKWRENVKYITVVFKIDNGYYENGEDLNMGYNITASQIDSIFPNLYLVFSPFEYTFNANGGVFMSDLEPTRTITRYGLEDICIFGESAKEDYSIYRSGYSFHGWKISSDTSAGNNWMNGEIYLEDMLELFLTSRRFYNSLFANVTFDAQWTANTYTIEYDANGGSGAPSSQSYTYSESGSITLATTEPTRTGYKFAGWNTRTDGKGTEYQPGEVFYTSVFENTTLYAQWIPNKYTVIFDANNDYGGTYSQGFTYGERQRLYLNEFENGTGMGFRNWNTEPDGSGRSFDNNEEVVNLVEEDGGTITLYAQWSSCVTITFELGTVAKSYGAWASPGNYLNPNATVKKLNIVLGQESQYWDLSKDIPTSNIATYGFMGWNTAADGSGTYVYGPDGLGCSPYWDVSSKQYQSGSITVYAIFKTDGPYVTLMYYGNNGDDAAPIYRDVLKRATANYFTIRSVPSGAYFELEGYLFSHWNSNADGMATTLQPGARFPSMSIQAGTVYTLYAQWTPITYYIQYNANGGSGTMENSSHTYDTASNLTACGFTKQGHIFVGWVDSKGLPYSDEASVFNLTSTSGEIVELTAQWEPISYTIAFNANGGSGTMAELPMTYGVAKALTSGAFTRTGYDKFLGWNTAPDGSGTSYSDGESVNNLTEEDGAIIVLFAQWEANTYTLEYNANGGSGSMSSETHTYDATKLLAPNTFTRTGYTFLGWSEDSNATEPTYEDEELVSNLTSTNNATVTLYAVWQANTYTVTLNANGGVCSDASVEVVFDDSYGVLPTPTRTGYTFTGWFTSASGGTQITAATTVSTASDHTLYAQWTANTYNITFDANGGSGAPSSQSYTYAESGTITLTTDEPTRTGYTFVEWNTVADGSGTSYSAGGEFGRNIANDTTLYAVWQANTYTITFDANGGTDAPNSQSYTFAESGTITLTTAEPTRTGYTFVEWNTESDGSGISYVAGDEFGRNIANDTTLYAQWQANTYTIVYDANGGSGTMENSSHTYDVLKALTENAFTRIGYDFAGWNTKADGTGTPYPDKVSVSNLTATNGGTVTLFAQWTPRTDTKYVVNHYHMNVSGSGYTLQDTEEKTGTTDASLTLSDLKKVYVGFTYRGGKGTTEATTTIPATLDATTTILADGTRVINLYYTRNRYTVTLTEGTGISGVSGEGTYYYGASVTIDATVSAGYTWSEWSGSHSTTTKIYTFIMPAADVTDKANAVANTYTITFDGNGGVNVPNSQSYIFAETGTITLTTDEPTKTGYTFIGWNTESDGSGTSYAAGGEFGRDIAKDTTLYAQWTPITYTIEYDANGGSGTMENSSHTYDVLKALNLNTFTRTGYTFLGWSEDSTATVATYTNGQSVINLEARDGATVRLYAVWEANTYTITFDANGGSGAPGNQTYTFAESGSIELSLTVPVRAGYTFTGWNTAADGSGTFYIPGADFSRAIASDTTLYAQWKMNAISVSIPKQLIVGADGTCSFVISSDLEVGEIDLIIDEEVVLTQENKDAVIKMKITADRMLLTPLERKAIVTLTTDDEILAGSYKGTFSIGIIYRME